MKILVIGSGGREYSIIKSLYSRDNSLYYHSNIENYGMSLYSKYINSIDKCLKLKFNLVIIGPEKYLFNKTADLFLSHGIPCIGPTSLLAQIETNKAFGRLLLKEIGLESYSPRFKIFDYSDSESNFCHSLLFFNNNYVIKPIGLHGGKGVKVYGDHLKNLNESIEYCKYLQKTKEPFIIEEKLQGFEFSLMSFSDGYTLKHMPFVQDFKRAFNNNIGPNTGSMGSITYADHKLPFLSDDDIYTCKYINQLVINEINKRSPYNYKGIIYGSFMKTYNGNIKVIEFNARFGDPECINIFSILETNFTSICKAIINGTLDDINITYKNKATCCKYLVPKGYPDKPIKNHEIYFDNEINFSNIIYANLKYASFDSDSYFYESGSRTIAIISSADNLSDAEKFVEKQIKYIHGPLFHRSDIGKINYNNLINYKNSGVDIDEGNKVITNIKKYVESTFNNNVISKFGDFSGLFQIDLLSYHNPILVSSTDGVGTKSILVLEKFGPELGYEMLGTDLVNHSINDILVKGGKPLFFLDYYASSIINSKYVEYFVKGISNACKNANCVLIGGETAEMPDIYLDNKCDIVGTMIGIVEKNNIINGKQNINDGDLILGLNSSGPHTNGFSLIRKILNIYENNGEIINIDIINKLCNSHISYLDDINFIIDSNIKINGLCHITGGGWYENSSRVIPDNLEMKIFDYIIPEPFKFIMDKGNIDKDEMFRVFNCGIGMMVFVPSDTIIPSKYNIIGVIKNKNLNTS